MDLDVVFCFVMVSEEGWLASLRSLSGTHHPVIVVAQPSPLAILKLALIRRPT